MKTVGGEVAWYNHSRLITMQPSGKQSLYSAFLVPLAVAVLAGLIYGTLLLYIPCKLPLQLRPASVSNCTATPDPKSTQTPGALGGNAGDGGRAQPTWISFSADKTTSVAGESVHLSWSARDALRVHISGIGPVPAEGAITVSPLETTQYMLIAEGPTGKETAGVLVTVIPPASEVAPTSTAERALAQLKPGKITYDPPSNMEVAVPYEIHVRIGRLRDRSVESATSLDAELTRGLGQSARTPASIQVSITMKVD